MKIRKVKLTNFRNYTSLELNLNDSMNIFYGNNGQGKTNLVEAIYFTSLLKSFREDEIKPLIKSGSDNGIIEIEALINGQRNKFKVILGKRNKKLMINNKEIKKVSDFVGQLNVVSFIPKDVFLFQASPKSRRDFVDDEIIKLSPSYSLAFNDYTKLVKERNEIFKTTKPDLILIEVINKQLAKLSVEILSRRYKFIDNLNNELISVFEKLTNSKSKFIIKYQSFISEKDINEKNILDKIHEKQKEDMIRQTTSIGPHRDDYEAEMDKQNIAQYGSQGQQRVAVIATKLALINLIFKQIGEQPIVVLDDVLSELDIDRQSNVINYFKNQHQLFITTANLNKKILDFKNKNDADLFRVESSKIIKE